MKRESAPVRAPSAEQLDGRRVATVADDLLAELRRRAWRLVVERAAELELAAAPKLIDALDDLLAELDTGTNQPTAATRAALRAALGLEEGPR